MPANKDTHPTKARLALEDGSVFHGAAFGDTTPRTITGEACFNTGLSGYQEVLTDPSYSGQIVAMTYPLIGNYGINERDLESTHVQVAGFAVRELAHHMSNYRASARLEDWLAEQKIIGITGIDTRALTRKLRIDGAMDAALSTDASISDEELVRMAREAPGMVDQNLAKVVSRRDALTWDGDLGEWAPLQGDIERDNTRYNVLAIDCGAKQNILRNLVDSGCNVTVMPYNTTADDILAHKPDGLFISNGPGDPAAVNETIEQLGKLHGKLPIFGICLGHQLLGKAIGAETFKLKFGHRGSNQPVQNLHTGKVEITSQNHGFAVDKQSLQKAGAEATHINLNDQTLEGFRHASEPTFAVQYHPEASPGPHDARYLFDCFIDMMRTGTAPTGEQMDHAQRQRNRVTV